MSAIAFAVFTVCPAHAFIPASRLSPKIATCFEQVYPSETSTPERQERAVVLVHGLRLHPLRAGETHKARLHGWQKANSVCVRAFAAYADVYAFAYSQNVAVDEIARQPSLAAGIASLREQGYREIVLIGHSAGGLIARQFVEDHPDCGVTKVMQVCAPNAGAGIAKLHAAATVYQRPFILSLTKEARRQAQRQRGDVSLPAGVNFVCVIGCGAVVSDGIVSVKSQWPEELRAQGVPGHSLISTHFTVMRSPIEIGQLVKLAFVPDGPRVAGARRFSFHALIADLKWRCAPRTTPETP